MATLEQMTKNTRPITTQSGVRYELPRPSLAIRMDCLDFAEKSMGLQSLAESENNIQAVRELCSLMIELLEKWLRRGQPDITRDQIANDFDIGDIPAIMEIMNNFEQEVQAALPPVSGRQQGRPPEKK